MTGGAVFPLLFSFTMPLLLGNLLQQTYSLIDAAIVGKFLGINSLAAVGASTSVIFLILGFCNGCCAGFGIPVAQKFGARDYATMRRYVAVGLQLATVMSVVIAAVSGFYCRDILRGMQTPGNIFDGAYDYLFVTFIGIPCTFFYNLLASIMRALGDSKTPFWFLLFSTVLNVFLDLFCILVLGWGVMGAAIATVFSQGLSAILCYLYMLRKFPILRATSSEDRRFHAGLARTLLAMGVPMGLQFSITAIGSIMLQSANNALGTACVAAFTSAARIKMFFICAFESLGIAMATYCGQNYGAGKPERAKKSLAAGLLFAVAASSLFWLWAQLSPQTMIGLFSSDPAIIEAGIPFFRTCSYDYLAVSFVFCMNGFFSGGGRAAFPLVHSAVATFAVRVPLSWCLSRGTGATLRRVGLAAPAATLVSLLLCQWYLMRSGAWQAEKTPPRRCERAGP